MDDLNLDRELQSAFAVEPSPEFVARVRTRIAQEPRPSHIAGLLKPAVAIACVVVMVVAVGLREDARLKPRSTEIGANGTEIVTSPPPVTAGLKASTTKTKASTTKTKASTTTTEASTTTTKASTTTTEASTTTTEAGIPLAADAHAAVVPALRPAGAAKTTARSLSVAERTSAAAEPPMPEVIVASADIKALQEYLTGANERRFVASFDAAPAPAPWAMNDLGVAPITIEPLELAPLHNN